MKSASSCRRRARAWTTHEALARRYINTFRKHEPGLIGIGTVPAFAIGQRALLLTTDKGNVLWDCISLLDEATVEIVKGLGGLCRHRHFASALLRVDGRMGARLQRADPSACRRSPMGHAARSGDQVLGRRYAHARTRRHADSLRRSLRRRHGAALGARRRRPRHASFRRHRAGHSRPQVRHLHAQLPEHDSAVGARGRAHRRNARALRATTSSTAPGSTAPFRAAARRSCNDRSRATSRPCAATARPNCK